jgi:antitoxin ParD1/3/4
MYSSASEVVREALRLMDEQDRLRQVKLDDLRREVHKGLDSGTSEQWDAAAVKAKARARRVAKPIAA